MKKYWFFLPVSLIIIALLAISCAKTATPSTTSALTPKYGGTLRLADVVGPMDLGWPADPIFGIGGYTLNAFMDTILTADGNGNLGPCLATAWKIAPDLKSITLTLRKGVQFHDGSSWDATVAKWNFDQVIQAGIGGYTIISSVDIVDPYTIRLNLNTWSNYIMETLAETYVVSKAAYDAHGKQWMYSHVVGTGPFQFASFTPNVSIKGVKFANYWQKGKPYLDGYEFDYITDPTTKAQALKSGEVDAIGADLSNVEYDLEQAGFKIAKMFISIYCLIPDSAVPSSPLSNPLVRKAIDYAIDRDSIVKSLGYGFWSTTYQFALPNTSAYINNLPPRSYSVDQAKQLLAQAGYPNGFKTAINVDSFVSNKDAVTAIQAQLAKVGITVSISMDDMGAAQTLFSKGWTGWMGTARALEGGNENNALAMWTMDNPNLHVSVDKTADLYALYRASLTSTNYDPALVQKCVQYIYDDDMITPIYAIQRGVVMQNYVEDAGFSTHSLFWLWNPAVAWLNK
jgi:peptide/nickel transport system substrate-binding protein